MDGDFAMRNPRTFSVLAGQFKRQETGLAKPLLSGKAPSSFQRLPKRLPRGPGWRDPVGQGTPGWGVKDSWEVRGVFTLR